MRLFSRRILSLPLLGAMISLAACRPGATDDIRTDTSDVSVPAQEKTEAPPTPGAPAPGDQQPTGDQAADTRTLERLRQEATQLARAGGCQTAAQCGTAPMGAKPCGGPWQYMVYCRATTDTAALNARLARLRTFEQAYNQRHGLMSDCMMIMPPQPVIAGGACTAR